MAFECRPSERASKVDIPEVEESGYMTTFEFQAIRLAREAGTTTLTLARPQVRNALDHAMMVEIERAIMIIGGDPDVRVLVIRGEGGHFCAGGDLNAMANPPEASANGDDPTLNMYRRYESARAACGRAIERRGA